jgi:hypothetical protein
MRGEHCVAMLRPGQGTEGQHTRDVHLRDVAMRTACTGPAAQREVLHGGAAGTHQVHQKS